MPQIKQLVEGKNNQLFCLYSFLRNLCGRYWVLRSAAVSTHKCTVTVSGKDCRKVNNLSTRGTRLEPWSFQEMYMMISDMDSVNKPKRSS